uniref:uracil-DNA glycosylase family protein n=1 Tax=Comamonas thiooxydans TaxID=363952 RepID=UPI00325F9678
ACTAGEPGLGWTISPAQLVYPHAPQHVHSAEQGGWLILLEPAANPPLLSPAQRPAADSAQTALQGDAAKLLDNMLRALGLQEKPRVFSAALHRAPPDADLSHAQALQPALETLLRELRPDCVLVLGLASARAVLGRHDALGRLRAEPHHIAGVPTVVTYDPNYLLRAPQAKAGAWADLVQADAFTKGL